MKKSLLFFLLFNVYFCTTTFAQVEKGRFLIDGGITLGFGDKNEEFDFTTDWTPQAGYFIVDKFMVGMGFGLTTLKIEDNSRREVFFSPFVRYYFGKTKFQPFAQVDMQNNKLTFSNSSFKFTQNAFYLRAGFDYFITKNIALEGSLGFRLSKNDDFNLFFHQRSGLSVELGDKQQANLSLGIKFFLGGSNNGDGENEPLLGRYLQKGNQNIGFQGLGFTSFKFIQINGRISWRKFTRNNRRWSHTINTLLFIDGENAGFLFYTPEFEPFISLSKNAFFVPSIGANLGLIEPASDNTLIFLGAGFHPKLVYFFNNALMEIGVDIESPLTDFDREIIDWSGNFTLASEFFVQENLSLRGEVTANSFGDPNIQHLTSNFDNQRIPEVKFSIGINYFFNKTNQLESTENKE